MRSLVHDAIIHLEKVVLEVRCRGFIDIMRSLRLSVARQELLLALQTLGVTRRKRFSSVLPVWLKFDPDTESLQIVEDRGAVCAGVPATGSWPPAGATVGLFILKGAVTECHDEDIELHATIDAVILLSGERRVQLNLLNFGPENTVTDLPLFRWANRKP